MLKEILWIYGKIGKTVGKETCQSSNIMYKKHKFWLIVALTWTVVLNCQKIEV